LNYFQNSFTTRFSSEFEIIEESCRHYLAAQKLHIPKLNFIFSRSILQGRAGFTLGLSRIFSNLSLTTMFVSFRRIEFSGINISQGCEATLIKDEIGYLMMVLLEIHMSQSTIWF